MKTLSALTFAAALASAPAFACDDMRAGGDGDGGAYQASKAPEVTAAAVDKQAPLTVTSKKQPVKKTAAGKPLPSTTVSMTRTN